MRSILVIDCGSSSMRGVLFDESGEIRHVERISYFMDIDGSAATQDAAVYRESLISICAACAQIVRREKLTLGALSITSQRSSVLPVDQAGRPLGKIITWYDRRSQDICQEKLLLYRKEILAISGTRTSPVLSAPKMLWLKRNYPDCYADAHKLLGIHDYLLFLCTGNFVTDVTLASRSNLMDIRSLCWSERLGEIFEIDRSKLCHLLSASGIAGAVTSQFEALTDLPAGTPVVSGGGDQQCSVLGQGLFEDGQTGITCGTGAYIAAVCNAPRIDSSGTLSLNAAVCPGHWILESSIPAAGSVFDWFNRNFYASEQQSYPQERINAEIASSPAGANGITMNADLINGGGFSGLRLSHTRADIARAMAEGIAANLAERFFAIRRHTGAVKDVKLTGGLTKSPEFNQIIADMIDFPVENCMIKETTAMGAFMAAAVALGWYSNLSVVYRQCFGRAANRRFDPEPERAALYRTILKTRKG